MRGRRLMVAAAALLGSVVVPARADAETWRCPQFEPALRRYAPTTGWDIGRMSYTMYRESRCLAWVESRTYDVGLLQVNWVNREYIAMRFHLPTAEWWFVKQWLKTPVNNIQAASVLSKFAAHAWGDWYRPWRIR